MVRLRNPFPPFLFGIPSICDRCKPMNNCRDWAFSNSGLEVWLPAFQLPMFAKCDSLPKRDLCDMFVSESIPSNPFGSLQRAVPTRILRFLRAAVRSSRSALSLHHAQLFVGNGAAASLSAADARKMWLTAEWRFVGHACLRNPFLPFLASTPYQKLQVPESSSMLWNMAASCPSLHCNWRKRLVACREAEGLVREFWSPRFVAMQWLCPQSCYLTAANQWTILEIELLATVGWTRGCQPFSCPRSQNVTHCRKEICDMVRLRNPFPPFLFRIPSIHSLPEAGSESCSTFRHLCIMPIPSLQLQKKLLACREAEKLVTELWSPRCSDCALSCAMWLLQTNEQLSRLSF